MTPTDYKAEFEWGPFEVHDSWANSYPTLETPEQLVRRYFKKFKDEATGFINRERVNWNASWNWNRETTLTFIHLRIWPLELPSPPGIVLGTTQWDLLLRGNFHVRAEGPLEVLKADVERAIQGACAPVKITAEL